MSDDVLALLVMAGGVGLMVAYMAGAILWFHFRLYRARRAWRRLSRQMVRESLRRARERQSRDLHGESFLDALKGLGKTGRR